MRSRGALWLSRRLAVGWTTGSSLPSGVPTAVRVQYVSRVQCLCPDRTLQVLTVYWEASVSMFDEQETDPLYGRWRSLCQLTEGAQVTLPYTLAVYMVRAWMEAGVADGAVSHPAHPGGQLGGLNEQEVGWKTGVLVAMYSKSSVQQHGTRPAVLTRMGPVQAACWCFSQFWTSFAWGRASDRLGRKVRLLDCPGTTRGC